MDIRIVTPTEVLFEGSATMVNFPSKLQGLTTILPDHEPGLTALTKGIVVIEKESSHKREEFEVPESGYVNVEDNQVLIMIN